MIRCSFVFVVLGLAVLGCSTTSTHSAEPPHESTVAVAAPALSAKAYAKPSQAEIESRLTKIQFEVTQHAATEPPFRNAYWDNHQDGIYVDVVTGEPLFSSRDKFESGTGWPSFTRPIEKGRVVDHTDATLGMVRTEVVSSAGGSHLGHVFEDGPAPTNMRYCINSASLRFIPKDRLAAEGYAEYAALFADGPTSQTTPPPAATHNSCALPPPGKKAGCSATLDVAVFAELESDARIAEPAGVLEIAHGYEGAERAVEVTFDPAKLTYAQLLQSWTSGREKQSTVFTRNDAQKHIASGTSVRVVDAVPFRRETST